MEKQRSRLEHITPSGIEHPGGVYFCGFVFPDLVDEPAKLFVVFAFGAAVYDGEHQEDVPVFDRVQQGFKAFVAVPLGL